MHVLALDLHRHKTTVADLSTDGQVLHSELNTTTEAFTQWAGQQISGSTVVMEACGPAYAVYKLLKSKGLKPKLATCWAVGRTAMRRHKDDQLDALRLAQLEQHGALREDYVHMPDDQVEELRLLVAHRQHLSSLRTSLKNRLYAVLGRNLLTWKGKDPCNSEKGIQAFLERGKRLPVVEKLIFDQDVTHLRLALLQIEEVERELALRLRNRPEVPLLFSVPGFALPTVAALVASLAPITRFRSPRQVASYLGLAPRRFETAGCALGPSAHHITRMGNKMARYHLFQAAMKTARTPGPLRVVYEDMLAAGKRKKVIFIALARKLATMVFWILKRQVPCRWSPPVSTHEKLRQLALAAGEPKLPSGPKGQCRGGRAAYTESRRRDRDAARAAETEHRLHRAKLRLVAASIRVVA